MPRPRRRKQTIESVLPFDDLRPAPPVEDPHAD